MTEENLGEVLDDSYREHQRTVVIKNLGDRTHLTLGQIAKLCDHPQHGEIVAAITLQELLDVEEEERSVAVPPAHSDPTPPPRSAKKKKAAKKSGKKTSAKRGASKKAAKKKGAKADKGKPKPRLDYETGTREVLGALKAAKEPMGRSAIENATGFTGVQVRAFAKKLKAAGKVNILGEGGRSTKYESV